MFIATTQTPSKELSKQEIIDNFGVLLGRTCEYIKELEEIGCIQKGTYFKLYENFHKESEIELDSNWIK
jgi:hypothetical protein